MSEPPLIDDRATPAHAEAKATLLITVVVTLLIAFVVYVMVARGVFERTRTLDLVAENAEGVVVGMPISFTGFAIGQVRDVTLGDDGKARIRLAIPEKDARWLRTSSVFTLERSLVGGVRLRAYSGLLDDPPLPSGSERTVHIGDATADIPMLLATLRTVAENIEQLSNPSSALNTTLKDLKVVTARMSGPQGVLGAALGEPANAAKVLTLIDQSNRLLAQAEQRLFAPEGLADQTQASVADLRTLLASARNSLSTVEAMLADAKAVSSEFRVASADLGTLRAEVDLSLRKLSHLIDEINRKWPFARDTTLTLP